MIPDLTSISQPTFNTPLRILPPAIPLLKSSTSRSGLLTSKNLITTVSQGSKVKFLGGHWNFLYHVFIDNFNIIFQLSRNWKNRSSCYCTLYKCKDLFIPSFSLAFFFFYQINFILQNQNIFQLYNFCGSWVFRSLRLRTNLITSYQQNYITAALTVQHSSHQNMATTVNTGKIAD